MSLKVTLDQDLKQALLGGDKLKSDTIRIIKSTILNQEIASGKREQDLPDEEIIVCLKKEAKKRQEAADLYKKAGSLDRADKELAEKKVIETYLPAAMSEADIAKLVEQAVASHGGSVTQQTMGIIIGEVKKASNGAADGATIAKLVKEKLAT